MTAPIPRTVVVVGANHRTAPIAVRERLAVPTHELPSALTLLQRSPALREAVILSTCNRTEGYVACDHPATACEALADFLSHRSRLSPDALRPALYCRIGLHETARHLFRVSAGLDSMILGESEIAAQVKQAYVAAQAQGTTGPLLNRLFQKALHSAKLIRSRTQIGEGRVSIGSIVVDIARSLFGDSLKHCDVLLWGAGKAAEATMKHLIRGGIGHLWIVNRTQTKAQELALLCEGGWLSWEQALKHLAHVDIAVVCTQAPHYVIDQADADVARVRRGTRPLCLIDLAVPRNVDPALKGQPGITLYDIDDLQAVAQAGVVARHAELEHCAALIQQQVDHFLRWQGRIHSTETVTCQPLGASS